jgi:hypothetical protein
VSRLTSCLLLATTLGCDEKPAVQGAVGVFYGGQVQELERIDVDPLRAPTFGFRVELPEHAAAADHQLRWEVVRPGPAGRRVTEVGEARIPAGREELQQVLPLDLREVGGLMNVRVLVDGQVVIDRAIDVRKP